MSATAATPPPARMAQPPTLSAWPSLRPIAPGSPIIETWGGYAAPCMDCGFMVTRKTPEEVRDALADKDSWHGFQACREAAAKLTEAEKARLQQLHLGEPEKTQEKPRKKGKGAKEGA